MRKLVLVLFLVASSCALPARSGGPLVGAVYPTGGGQGRGGVDEYRGVKLAADLAGIRMRLERADSADAAPGAVRRLRDAGARLVVGSYGSTISVLAARTASDLGMLFWETGAVGEMPERGYPNVFRFPPTGRALGRASVAFVRDELSKQIGSDHRYAVAFVDDEYGRSVGNGAIEEIRGSGLPLVATFGYDLRTADYTAIARGVRDAGADVLVVSAYLEDGLALRRATIAERVPLAASIGTSSSYCMPEFGIELGADAVGLFASDKPSGDVVDAERLRPEGASILQRARAEYRRRHGEGMSGAALSGFAAGWALFGHVLPRSASAAPDDVADAARSIRLEPGALPNGSGLEFDGAGVNVRASSVIWEWVAPARSAVVWPPAFATSPVLALPIA